MVSEKLKKTYFYETEKNYSHFCPGRNNQEKNKNVLIYATIAVLLGLAVGYYLGTNLEKSKAKQSRQAMFKEVFANVGFVNNLSGKILEISSDKKSLIVEVPGVYGLNLSKKYQKRKVFSSIEVQPQ